MVSTSTWRSLLDCVEQMRLQQYVVMRLASGLLQQCFDGAQRHGAQHNGLLDSTE
jgi:hypothetical protein